MKFSLTIESDDQAASDQPIDTVLAGLDTVVSRLDAGEISGIVLDANGNRIGSWEMRP